MALATTGVLVLGIAASLSGSDSEQAGGSPQAQSNVAEEPLGSDRHLENRGAWMRAEAGAVNGSDRYAENRALRDAAGAS